MYISGQVVGVVVPIQRLLRDGHFTPEEIGILVTAFEGALCD
jgi:hypothetical protein